MLNGYIPEKGDIVWMNFDPQSGREMSQRRPSIVISPHSYNSKTSLVIVCPITSSVKGYPFEVTIPQGLRINGVILSDQVKSLDWNAREAEFVDKLPVDVFNEVIAKIQTLICKYPAYLDYSNLFDGILEKHSSKVSEDISLVIGTRNVNGAYTQAIAFIGYLIDQVQIVEHEDFGNKILPVFEQSQYFYYSPDQDKFFLHLVTNYEIHPAAPYIENLHRAEVKEVKNFRSFIENYPSLAKKIGLPFPLPPDILPIEEVNIGII